MTAGQPGPQPVGPLGTAERAPAPDLARGAMLLLIALANTPFYLYGRAHSEAGFHPVDGSPVDRVVQAALIIGVDMRVYPMFAFLFGYGLAVIRRRQAEAGVPDARAFAVLRRRNLWLIAFGLVHALLLWGGDVLGAYGLCGLVLTWLFLRRSDRTLLVWSALGTVVLTAFAAFSLYGAWAVVVEGVPVQGGGLPAFVTASASATDPLTAALDRMLLWPFIVLGQGLFGIAVPVAMLLGVWAARRRVLERPAEHRRLLWPAAVTGVAVGWLGGLPHALAHVGVLPELGTVVWAFTAVQMVTGLVCGIGYVAVFGLLAARLEGRPPGRVASAVTALGRRSMTGYLGQSVLCAPVLAAWGLGVGGLLGSAGMAVYAVGVWTVTVAVAVALERAGRTGPAEQLLRRLAYRPGR